LFASLACLALALTSFDDPAAGAPAPDELPLRLSWSAPDGCPSASSVRAEIRRRVDLAAGGQVSDLISAEAEIRATSSGAFQLSLRTTVGQTVGERELSGPDCSQLADAAALVLALLIRPQTAAEPPRATPPVVEQPRTGQPAHLPRFAVGMGGVVAYRVLPSLTEGLDLRFVMQGARWAAMVRAGGFLSRGADAPILPGARATFYRWEWAAAACVQTWPGRRAGAALCAGGALVRVSGESAGVASRGQAAALWPEALAEASVYVHVTPWARVRLSLEGRALGRAPDFAILGLGSVYRPASASLRGALGVDVLF
jgi:hypothetical protein